MHNTPPILVFHTLYIIKLLWIPTERWWHGGAQVTASRKFEFSQPRVRFPVTTEKKIKENYLE